MTNKITRVIGKIIIKLFGFKTAYYCRYLLDKKALIKELSARFIDFKTNSKFHNLREKFMEDENLSRKRFLNPYNTKSSSQDFYSPNIVKKFDKHYKKKRG